ncbi:hypothetical protein [Nonomuraea sp. NPDC050310]|uniref:hypothetical protein n=1 Tax=Nonomuraea sp. NPDC050310 TaxID=3154935 RepID=UPI00340C2578
MKLALTVHQVHRLTVLRPARPLRHAVLLDEDRSFDAYLDQEAARRIGALWELAAASPHALVHVPLRGNAVPASVGGGRRLDLVLVHHSLQFRPSRWKEVRGRLGAGRARTVEVGWRAPEIDHAAGRFRENRDLFHQHVHAETLFMTGSAKAFRDSARHLFELAPAPDGTHSCTELDPVGRARLVHFVSCEQW